MTVKELKEMLQDLPEKDEVFFKVDGQLCYKLYNISREIYPNKEEYVIVEVEES